MARARKPSKKSPAKKKPPTRKPPAKKKAAAKKPLSPAAKRKLAAAKAAITRKANLRARQDAEAASFNKKLREKAKLKKQKTRKAKAAARQLATRARPGGQPSIIVQLEDAYETMRQLSPYAMSLEIEHSPVTDRGLQPWLLLGDFETQESITWAELGRVFQIWENDLFLAAAINPDRYSLIRIIYLRYDEDGEPVGEPEGYSPASSGSWDSVISECVADLIGYDYNDPDEDSLAAIYQNTAILSVEVLFSASLFSGDKS